MKRDISLEYLKFFATLLIINSHIGTCYGDYEYLATGGAIGNGLFFFVSGFALSLGRLDRMDNWLKRRCLRLFPSVISKDILGGFLFGTSLVAVNQLVNRGGWFLVAICIFYPIIYLFMLFDERLKKICLWIPVILTLIGVLVWYFFFPSKATENLYAAEFRLSWAVYFGVMVLGTYFGKVVKNSKQYESKIKRDVVFAIGSIVLYYGILAMASRIGIRQLELLSILPFYFMMIALYMLFRNRVFQKIWDSRSGIVILFISSLCWESYLTQLFFFFTYNNHFDRYIPFPLNIPATFIAILFTAFIIKVLSRLIIQLFNKENFDWLNMIKIWER